MWSTDAGSSLIPSNEATILSENPISETVTAMTQVSGQETQADTSLTNLSSTTIFTDAAEMSTNFNNFQSTLITGEKMMSLYTTENNVISETFSVDQSEEKTAVINTFSAEEFSNTINSNSSAGTTLAYKTDINNNATTVTRIDTLENTEIVTALSDYASTENITLEKKFTDAVTSFETSAQPAQEDTSLFTVFTALGYSNYTGSEGATETSLSYSVSTNLAAETVTQIETSADSEKVTEVMDHTFPTSSYAEKSPTGKVTTLLSEETSHETFALSSGMETTEKNNKLTSVATFLTDFISDITGTEKVTANDSTSTDANSLNTQGSHSKFATLNTTMAFSLGLSTVATSLENTLFSDKDISTDVSIGLSQESASLTEPFSQFYQTETTQPTTPQSYATFYTTDKNEMSEALTENTLFTVFNGRTSEKNSSVTGQSTLATENGTTASLVSNSEQTPAVYESSASSSLDSFSTHITILEPESQNSSLSSTYTALISSFFSVALKTSPIVPSSTLYSSEGSTNYHDSTTAVYGDITTIFPQSSDTVNGIFTSSGISNLTYDTDERTSKAEQSVTETFLNATRLVIATQNFTTPTNNVTFVSAPANVETFSLASTMGNNLTVIAELNNNITFSSKTASSIAITSTPTNNVTFTSIPTINDTFTSVLTNNVTFTSTPTNYVTLISMPTNNVTFTSASTNNVLSTSPPTNNFTFTSIHSNNIPFTPTSINNVTFTSILVNNVTFRSTPINNVTFTSIPPSNVTYTLTPTNNVTFTLIPTNNVTFASIPINNVTFASILAQNITSTLANNITLTSVTSSNATLSPVEAQNFTTSVSNSVLASTVTQSFTVVNSTVSDIASTVRSTTGALLTGDITSITQNSTILINSFNSTATQSSASRSIGLTSTNLQYPTTASGTTFSAVGKMWL